MGVKLTNDVKCTPNPISRRWLSDRCSSITYPRLSTKISQSCPRKCYLSVCLKLVATDILLFKISVATSYKERTLNLTAVSNPNIGGISFRISNTCMYAMIRFPLWLTENVEYALSLSMRIWWEYVSNFENFENQIPSLNIIYPVEVAYCNCK